MRKYPNFVDDAQFYAMHADQSDEKQLTAMLQNTKRVFNLAYRQYESYEHMVDAYLHAGLAIFELQTGIVSRISNEQYHVMGVVSNLDAIQPGDIYPIEGTYCNEVYTSGCVIGFPAVGNLDYMRDHPVYHNLKLEAYLSAPIYVDGVLYGTLNFSSTAPRVHGFSQHERELIAMMSRAIGIFLELSDREVKLMKANTRLKKFVGFVAHDLRSPLGSISSMAKMGAQSNTSEKRRADILNRIERLSCNTLEYVQEVLENAALGTGKLTPKLRECQLLTILHGVCLNLEELQQLEQKRVEIGSQSDIQVICDPRLIEQALINLVMNAIKYSPKGDVITVEILPDTRSATIQIHNAKATEVETTRSQYGSIGFGLDIAQEILNAHGAQLDIDDRPSDYRVQFSLPMTS